MGQFRATERCPLCDGANGDRKWTCVTCTGIVDTHRELLRNLQQWRAHFESGEIDEVLVVADGREYCIWDVDRFYKERLVLPDRQCQSIQFCLYENMKEKDAAIRMGIKPTNPVSVYATIGLTSLLVRTLNGDIPGYSIDVGEMVA